MMKKKKYNFNNIEEESNKQIENPQERTIAIDKRNANRAKPKNV